MTRETKIGLLVGLAFIIVIGILLSDHLSSTTEPPPAYLAQAGASVRQGVNVPGVPPQPGANTVTTIAPPTVIPQQQVPTQEELSAPRPRGVVQIGIGPVQTTETPTGTPPATTPPQVTFVDEQPTPGNPTSTSGTTSGTPGDSTEPVTPNDPLAEIAKRAGEELVGLDGKPIENTSGLANNNGAKPTELSNGFREYRAVEGDTVSRMASRFLGENTPANRDLIVRANPSLQKNPDIVVSGRTYNIPMTKPAQTAVVTHTKSDEAPDNGNIYTVQPGDSLWKIASNECGTPSAVASIKELNADVLKGGDTVQVGMKLKLPAKSVASAN